MREWTGGFGMSKCAGRINRHKSEKALSDIQDHGGPIALPPALAVIAAGRDHILTTEFATATNRATQTIRKNFCTKGDCFGIRPIKFGNRLLWPVREIADLLNGNSP